MDSARLNRIQSLFHEVADLPDSERDAFLAEACGEDKDLRDHVLGLLEEDARGGSLLDRDLAQVAGDVLTGQGRQPPVDTFGPYRITRFLGEGGMGVVYLAERSDLERLAAIKILRDSWLSPARREQFASEQRTLAQLTHPLIARLYDADTLPDGTPYFVMEYVEGVPLTEYARQHDLPVRQRIELFRSVCEAVAYAHQHAIIHRDLKPSNILVKTDGTVSLLDFGISKQLDSVSTASNPTLTGLRFMTPAYAAPEQIRGERLGVQADVYSLGVVLYELLAGKLPFDLSNRTPGQAERIILDQEPEKPSLGAKRTSRRSAAASWADLDVLCLTAMHKDAARRYRSVEGLIRDIDHYLRDEPLEARPDDLGYRIGKFLRRNRRAVAASAAALVLVVGLTAFFMIRLNAARKAALAEAARTERVRAFMTRLFQGGDQSIGPADDLRVVTLLDRGVKEAGALSSVPEIQAELYDTLGDLYDNLGKFDKADSLLNLALNERRSLPGTHDAQVAETLIALSLMRAHQARFEEAEKMAREGVDIAARLAPTHPVVGRANYALATVLVDRGAYKEAIPVLEETVRLQSAPGAPKTELSDSLTELANAQFFLGRYGESYALNTRVLEVDRQLYGPRHPNVGEDLLNLGAMQLQWGHYAEAERFDREALDLIQSWFGRDHPETASALTAVGRVLVAANRPGEAIPMLREALAIQERVYGPTHPRVASALTELGKAALQAGNLDEAEAEYRRTAEIYKSVYGQNHFLIATALSNLGNVCLERKQYARAEELLREAVRRNLDALGPGHANTAVTRIRLGRALARQQRWAEARVESAAGYDVLMKQAGAQANWLKMARQDLAEEYARLNDGVKAAQFQAELAKMTSPQQPPGGK
jgi:serine/threonine-protein kinase